jgi:hypothetical protein
MDVVIPYQKSYSIPLKCSDCGTVNPVSKFQVKSREVRQFATTASVTMTFLKCKSCVDELKAIKKSEKPAMLIGAAIGFLAGIGIGIVLFLSASDASTAQMDFINKLLGPLCTVGGIFGLIGLLIAKAIWMISLGSTTRQKIKDLEFPVTILDFGFQTGFLGNVKSAVLKLRFLNEAFSQEFMASNNFRMD